MAARETDGGSSSDHIGLRSGRTCGKDQKYEKEGTELKSIVLAGFFFGFVFAASDAAALYTSPVITVVPGGSAFPAVLQRRNALWNDPADFSWGLYPPSYIDRPGFPGFAYPEEWGPHYKLLKLECEGAPCLFCLPGPQPNQTIRITSVKRYSEGMAGGPVPLSYGHDHHLTSGPTGRFWKGENSELAIGEGVSIGSTRAAYILYETPEVSGVIQAGLAPLRWTSGL